MIGFYSTSCGKGEATIIRYLLPFSTPANRPRRAPVKGDFTPRQGQYLAFIHYYTKLNGRPPAEADMQRYFQVSPPTVHQMVLNMEERGLITRVPGQPRSICLLIPHEKLPALE